MFSQFRVPAGALLVACGLLAGCNSGPGDRPDLGEVSGRVTLDDQPLEGALVTFIPENGSPSYGSTDETGHYTLSYKPGVSGAAIGKHTVKISTFAEAYTDEEGKNIPRVEERVPIKYNRRTELTRDVEPGYNENVDFDLTTEGAEVMQPPPSSDG